MHPKIEARRRKVEVTRRTDSLRSQKEAILRDLRVAREALRTIRGDFMNTPSVDALVSSADEILKAVEEIDVCGDEERIRTCDALFSSSSKFVESVQRTVSAARAIMPD